MDAELYKAMARAEDTHWWFLGRRAIVRSLLERHLPAGDTELQICDIGCGTGGNLAMLARFGRVHGCEMEPYALEVARGRGVGELSSGSLPDRLRYAPASLDVVVMTDVLEHVAEDRAAVAAVRNVLKPGGLLLITVPALPWLWTARDVAHHHHRRYTRGSLRTLLRDAGLDVVRLSYFNTLLFPVALVSRLWQKMIGGGYRDDLRSPPGPLNGMLASVFASERALLRLLSLPVGLSLLAVARRRDEAR